jgi:hypothetical protein
MMQPPVHADSEGLGRVFRQFPGLREPVDVPVQSAAHLPPVDQEFDLTAVAAADVNAYRVSGVFDVEVMVLVHSGPVQALDCGRG